VFQFIIFSKHICHDFICYLTLTSFLQFVWLYDNAYSIYSKPHIDKHGVWHVFKNIVLAKYVFVQEHPYSFMEQIGAFNGVVFPW
jgi:hypothetical protein